MQFSEHCSFRYVELIAGLFWTLALPVPFVLILLKEGASVGVIFSCLLIFILWLAAIKILSMGIEDCYHNGKTALVLYDDGMDVRLHFKGRKSETRHFSFEEICNFYFVSNGTKRKKESREHEIKPNASGTLWFASKENGQMVYGVSVYNALSAAQWIISRLEEGQIDHARNEWTKDGRHTPKG